MPRSDGKSRPAEMRRNDTYRNPAGTDAQRFQAADGPGVSSSQSRKTKDGAEHAESKSSGRGGAGSPSGVASHSADKHHAKPKHK